MSKRKDPHRYPLDQSSLYRLRTRRKFAALFDITPAALKQLADAPATYRERQIEQKRANGKIKLRMTQEPRGQLRAFHERAKRLLSRIEPPGFLFCPVKRRSYVDNAAVHIGAAEVRTIDVQDYFISTSRRRVYWFFRTVMQCSPDVAAILAHLLTFNGHVATGSPVSPILSFFAFYDMWHRVAELAHVYGCKVTVYMDDLTISGEVVPEHLVWQIRKTLHGYGLRYHKERRFTGRFAEVTGVVLRDGKIVQPNRQRRRAYELRGELDRLSEGEERQVIQRKLTGLLAQRRQIEVRPASSQPAT